MQRAIFIAACVVAVLYTLTAMGSVAVLPLSEVAGETLAGVARATMPAVLSTVFLLATPIGAMGSTINSLFASYAVPFEKAADNGWLPKFLTRKNKFGTPYLITTYLFVLGISPVLLGFDITGVVMNITVMTAASKFMLPH